MSFTIFAVFSNLQKLLKYFFVTAIFVFVTFPSAPSTSVTPVMFDLYLNAVEVFLAVSRKTLFI